MEKEIERYIIKALEEGILSKDNQEHERALREVLSNPNKLMNEHVQSFNAKLRNQARDEFIKSRNLDAKAVSIQYSGFADRLLTEVAEYESQNNPIRVSKRDVIMMAIAKYIGIYPEEMEPRYWQNKFNGKNKDKDKS